MNRAEQQRHVESLGVRPGTSRRFHCPACGGRLTLSVSALAGELAWLCFRASCDVRGRKSVARTMADMIHGLDPEDDPDVAPEFTPPSWWTDVQSSDAALRWMDRFHVMPAYEAGWVTLRYDPREDRVVFLLHDDALRLVDAVGRALEAETPKWRRYAASGLPFVVNPACKVAVVVEDCASACAVAAAGFTGVALMGTRLLSSHIATIRASKVALVALDPDAAAKALQIQHALGLWMPARMIMLEDDPKYFDPAELRVRFA